MFNGLKYPDFKEIYEMVLGVMRVDENKEGGQRPTSYFDTPDDILVEHVKAKIKSNDGELEEFITFTDENYRLLFSI